MGLKSILRKLNRLMPNRMYISLKVKKHAGYWPNFKNPKTFNEKLQWLKLHDRKPEYMVMVDKFDAKKYVANLIGEEHIIPNLGVWDDFDQIDFDSLPEQFVLKCTHDSGGLVVCRDKSKLDMQAAKQKITNSLNNNYYWQAREWAYKGLKPRIIAEKYMEDAENPQLMDYKFYCFDGEPRFLYLSKGLENHATASISFYDLDFNEMPFSRSDYKRFTQKPKKPEKFEEMLHFARVLSKGIPFLRVDLYQVNGQVYFSELTFVPGGGWMPFAPRSADMEIGRMLKLPETGR